MNVCAKGRIVEVCPVERREKKDGSGYIEIHKYVAMLDSNGRPEYWKFEVMDRDAGKLNLQLGQSYKMHFNVEFRPYTRTDASGKQYQDYFMTVRCWSAYDENDLMPKTGGVRMV